MSVAALSEFGGFFEVVVVVAVEGAKLTVIDLKDPIDQMTQKITVVADDH